MGKETGIAWTDHTANLWWGCTEVHAGCDHCYARALAKSKGKGEAWEGLRYAAKGVWANLLKWDKEAARAGEVRRVFTGSMMDIFEKSMPACDWAGNPTDLTTGGLRDRYFREVVPDTPNLMHLLLTKRPGNIPKMVPPAWLDDWPANVMTGTSPVDQATADTLIPQLLQSPGQHFLSMEPLLGPVDLRRVPNINPDRCRFFENVGSLTIDGKVYHARRVNWVIIGGESGPKARRFEIDWARSILAQCQAANIPTFIKQLGGRAIDERNGVAGRDLRVSPDAAGLVAHRLKDGHGADWDEWVGSLEDLKVREFPASNLITA